MSMTPLDEKKYGDDVTNTAARAPSDPVQINTTDATGTAPVVIESSPENTATNFVFKPHPLAGHSLGGAFKSGSGGSRSFLKKGNRGWEPPSNNSKKAQRKAQKRARKRSP